MNVLEAALLTRLKTQVTFGSKVFNQLAPETQARPYVVFNFVGGGDLNETPFDRVEIVYRVKAISGDAAQAGTWDDLIRELLHGWTSPLTGWNLIGVSREAEIRYNEPVNGQTVFHAGGTYRCILTK